MTALAIVLDVALATVFVVAALGKISDWGAWRSALARLGLVALDNDTVAGGVIGMELVCAALLVAGLVPAAGALSAVLFGAFALTLVVAYARGARGDPHRARIPLAAACESVTTHCTSARRSLSEFATSKTRTEFGAIHQRRGDCMHEKRVHGKTPRGCEALRVNDAGDVASVADLQELMVEKTDARRAAARYAKSNAPARARQGLATGMPAAPRRAGDRDHAKRPGSSAARSVPWCRPCGPPLGSNRK